MSGMASLPKRPGLPGKCDRLPDAIRAELLQRLRDGQSGSTILPWLNGLEPVRAILRKHFQGLRINDQSLSKFRRRHALGVARKGKVARLPYLVREKINLRLRDNQPYAVICAWVNRSRKLRGPSAIIPQNLSAWRWGGFSEWLQGQNSETRGT